LGNAVVGLVAAGISKSSRIMRRFSFKKDGARGWPMINSENVVCDNRVPVFARRAPDYRRSFGQALREPFKVSDPSDMQRQRSDGKMRRKERIYPNMCGRRARRRFLKMSTGVISR